MPMKPDESAEQFDARLKAEHEARLHRLDELRSFRHIPQRDRAAALLAAVRSADAGHVERVPTETSGKRVRDMSPAERDAERAKLGLDRVQNSIRCR